MSRRKPTPQPNEPVEPWDRALGLLAVRARSQAEMARKLADMGFDGPAVKRTLAKLRSCHLLDDESLARGWIERRVRDGHCGPLLLRLELDRKGIGASLSSRLLEETFSDGRETLNARELLEKKFGSQDLADVRTLRRAMALLQRRGYGREVIGDLFDDHLRRLEETSGG